MDVGSLPLWNSSKLCTLGYQTCMSKGLYLLNDIPNDQMEMLSQDELVEVFCIKANFF